MKALRIGVIAERVRDPKTVILVLTVACVAYLALVPVVYLALTTFTENGEFSVEAFRRAYSGYDLAGLALNSAIFSAGASLVSLVTGTFLAFLTERTDIPLKRFVFVVSLVPLVIPGILYTIAWIFLASPRIGAYNQLLAPIFGPGALDIFTIGGLILVEGLSEAPIAFLLMVAAFRAMDPSLEEAAQTSGVALRQVVWRITLPLVRPAVLGAFLLLLVRNLQTFEGPALLGIPGGVWVFTSRIWTSLGQIPSDYGAAGALSLSLLAITSIGMFIYYRAVSGGRRFETISGKGFRPRTLPLGLWRGPMIGGALAYFLFAIAMPVLILLYMSTQRFYSPPTVESLSQMTLDNYRYVFDIPGASNALRNSIVLSLAAGVLVMVISALAAFLIVRTRLPGRWLLDNLMLLPLVMPGIVIGVALLTVYIGSPIPIYGTMWILLIAYITNKLPFGARFASVSMHQVGVELDESAQTSGATWLETFRRIYLPLLFPGLLAGFLYVVLTTMRELGSSILLYAPGNEVISVLIWELYANGRFSQLAALGVILIIILVVVVAIAQRLSRRIGIQSADA